MQSRIILWIFGPGRRLTQLRRLQSHLGSRIELAWKLIRFSRESERVSEREKDRTFSPGFSSALRRRDVGVDYYRLLFAFRPFHLAVLASDDEEWLPVIVRKWVSGESLVWQRIFTCACLSNFPIRKYDRRALRDDAFSLYRTYRPSILIRDDTRYRIPLSNYTTTR